MIVDLLDKDVETVKAWIARLVSLKEWKCNCCKTVFKNEQEDRTDDGTENGGAKCPACKADGQYTYRTAVEDLKSVLCDPAGNAYINGSIADNRVIDKALDRLTAPVDLSSLKKNVKNEWLPSNKKERGIYSDGWNAAISAAQEFINGGGR